VIGDDHVDQDAPNWRETAALLGGIDAAKKRARLVLDGFELAVVLARLEGTPVRDQAERMNLPVWRVYDLLARGVRWILRKMDPTMTMIDLPSTAAPALNRRIAASGLKSGIQPRGYQNFAA
jgi:hypothetical protein